MEVVWNSYGRLQRAWLEKISVHSFALCFAGFFLLKKSFSVSPNISEPVSIYLVHLVLSFISSFDLLRLSLLVASVAAAVTFQSRPVAERLLLSPQFLWARIVCCTLKEDVGADVFLSLFLSFIPPRPLVLDGRLDDATCPHGLRVDSCERPFPLSL